MWNNEEKTIREFGIRNVKNAAECTRLNQRISDLIQFAHQISHSANVFLSFSLEFDFVVLNAHRAYGALFYAPQRT